MQRHGNASDQQLRLSLKGVAPEDELVAGKRGDPTQSAISPLMARVLERENLVRALKQVKRNHGAPGIDGMTVEALPAYLKQHWPALREQLVTGHYRPQPVRRVEIPKPDGRKRLLGIPTVLDRFIQQAIAQVVQDECEPHFHPRSYGFRPGRSAHEAVAYAQVQIREGYGWVVDIDLDAFFDRVNHDRLMVRLRHHCADGPLLRLINRFLKAGVRIDGRTAPSTAGVPQGGPLSPVLSNVVLDELELGTGTASPLLRPRYADDCNIFVKSRTAGERVMKSVTRFLEESLRLKVNTRKSAVDRPAKRSFLGFTVSRAGKVEGGRQGHRETQSPRA